MVYLDSEDLWYREDTVITNAISKYGSDVVHILAKLILTNLI